jgi:ABC-type dipeptide/oligopeptide/nickel transport system permease subunit
VTQAAFEPSAALLMERVESPRSLSRDAWEKLRKSPTTIVCLAVAMFYLLVGLSTFSSDFDKKIELSLSADKTYAPPTLWEVGSDDQRHLSPAHWFGLDFQGHSVFWGTLYGTRVALLITVITTIMVTVIGTTFGIVSGYFGGWVDDLIVWLFSTISSIPWLLLVIAIAYVVQESNWLDPHPRLKHFFGGVATIIIALGLTDWVGLCRLIRGEVFKLRDRDFIVAARAMGLGHGRIIFRHILPNTVHIIIISASLGAVGYMQVEVILAFLGLGVTDKPSWGKMIDDAKLELLQGHSWELTAATGAIFIICLALNVLGDSLRDALDPRLRGVR